MNENSMVFLPEMAFVKRHLPASTLGSVSGAVSHCLTNLALPEALKPGETVAIAVGSRGISKIDRVVFHCLEFLKQKGLKPFIVPAMGSHGGGTGHGQAAVLDKLGISESAMGVPVVSGIDVVRLDRLPNGMNIYMSQRALEADHVVVINRIKPHTKFSADIESGLCKMLTIGLGKVAGATEFHRTAVRHGFGIIEDAAKTILEHMPVLFGLALIEDGYGQLARVEGVLPPVFLEREKTLLEDASGMMAHIPFDDLDLLVIDRFGKDISGIGMDSNVTGRHRDIVGDFFTAPHVKRIFVRDLSPGSDGNGNGIGLADVTTKRLVDALDLEKTYVNAVAAISPEKTAIPMHFITDRQCLDVCIKTAGLDSGETARIVRIKDTAHLECLQISKALKGDLAAATAVERLTSWAPLEFDENGNVTPFPSLS